MVHLRRFAWLAALLVVSLLLVSCGGSSDGQDSDTLPGSGSNGIDAPADDAGSQPLPGGVGGDDTGADQPGSDVSPDDDADDGDSPSDTGS